MTLRNLLLRAYPRSWRDEYGEELAGVLALRQLTAGDVANVLRSGAKQRFLRAEPWMICGLGLTLWTAMLLFGAGRFRTFRPFVWFYLAGQLFLFGAGWWTVLRKKSGILVATVASAKAALLPDVIVALVATVNLLRYWGTSSHRFGHSTSYWITKNVAIPVLLSLLFGLAGALTARFLTRFRKITPKAELV